MAALGDFEAVKLWERGVGLIAFRFLQRDAVLLIVDIGEPLEEEERKDAL